MSIKAQAYTSWDFESKEISISMFSVLVFMVQYGLISLSRYSIQMEFNHLPCEGAFIFARKLQI